MSPLCSTSTSLRAEVLSKRYQLWHIWRDSLLPISRIQIVLQEVEHLVNTLTVPIKPILLQGSPEPVSLMDARKGRTFILDTFFYRDIEDLLSSLQCQIIEPAEQEAKRLAT